MRFTIDDPDVERLARELAPATGESVPRPLAAAVRKRLVRVYPGRPGPPGGLRGDGAAPGGPRLGSTAEIQAYLAALPELDARTPDEILGYDALGLPRSRGFCVVIDTSALVAMRFGEPGAARLGAVVRAAPVRQVEEPTYVEAAVVLRAKRGRAGLVALDAPLVTLDVAVVPLTPTGARHARDAYDRYGAGRGEAAAALNLGDCLAYGAAADRGAPLLYKGDDFARTGVVAALLVGLRAPAEVMGQVPVPALAGPLDRAAPVRLLDGLVEGAPELYDVVAGAVGRRARARGP